MSIRICLKVHEHITVTSYIMSAMVSQITSLTIVYSTVYSGADQGKHQSSASLAFVRDRCVDRCVGNSPVTGEFPTQRSINAGSISIWRRHHERCLEILPRWEDGPGTNCFEHWFIRIRLKYVFLEPNLQLSLRFLSFARVTTYADICDDLMTWDHFY